MYTIRTTKAKFSWIKCMVGYAPLLDAGHGWVLGDLLYRDVLRLGPIALVFMRAYRQPGVKPLAISVRPWHTDKLDLHSTTSPR